MFARLAKQWKLVPVVTETPVKAPMTEEEYEEKKARLAEDHAERLAELDREHVAARMREEDWYASRRLDLDYQYHYEQEQEKANEASKTV